MGTIWSWTTRPTPCICSPVQLGISAAESDTKFRSRVRSILLQTRARAATQTQLAQRIRIRETATLRIPAPLRPGPIRLTLPLDQLAQARRILCRLIMSQKFPALARVEPAAARVRPPQQHRTQLDQALAPQLPQRP